MENIQMTKLRGMINPLLQRPLKMWERLRTTPEPQSLTNIIASLFTSIAFFAGDTDFEGYAIAGFEGGDGGADGGDDAGGFVAEG